MASRTTSSTRSSAAKHLLSLLAITLALMALVGGFAKWGGGQLVPRLGLDLEGGTEVVLRASQVGGQEIQAGSVEQAVDIIRQRIDSNGVSEAEISTQGSNNIVVAIPGKLTNEQLQSLTKPSLLSFRAVFVQEQQAPTQPQVTPPTGATDAPVPTGGATTPVTPQSNPTAAQGAIPQALQATGTATPNPAATTPAVPDPTAPAVPTPGATEMPIPTQDPAQLAAAMEPQVTSGLVEIGWGQEKAAAAAKKVIAEYAALDCTKPGAVEKIVDDPDQPLATCDAEGPIKYILGPTEIKGSEIADSSSGFQAGPNGQPTSIVEVKLKFKPEGAAVFAEVTKRLLAKQANPPTDQFAVVLDKQVITAPRSQAVITNGEASITGNFTIDSAKALSEQLKFGALPMAFTLQTQNDISPELGTESLKMGLLAGLIGLLLVVGYSIFQYRALAMVTVVSLMVAAILTYLAVTILGTTHGFRLTMAGVTGLIVAIGVTADSFIVYFERIRDEVREGRPLVSAVETGWKRARRTIIAADAVNFIAAIVLYVLASSNVRGFAFTLGLTTLIDLVVVVLFTHPTVQLLARTEFFGKGHKWSGLDPERLGAKVADRYRGRGRFGPSVSAADEAAASGRASGAPALHPRVSQGKKA